MTLADKLRLLKVEFPKTDEDTLLGILASSDAIVYNRVYGYLNPEKTFTLKEVEDMASVEIAKRILWKRGADGEQLHNENGVNVSWGTNLSGFDDVFKAWGLRPFVGAPIVKGESV